MGQLHSRYLGNPKMVLSRRLFQNYLEPEQAGEIGERIGGLVA
jgi:hypothetical protein